MGIFRRDDGKGIERLFIELGDAAKQHLVYKWPDQQIRSHSRVNVDVDYAAVFTNSGRVVGTFGPGRHDLGRGASLLTAWLTDHLTADGYYDCELYFVSTRLVTGISFGGAVDHVRDAETGFVAGLRVFGEFAARVVDPVALISNVVGSAPLRSDAQVRSWLTAQVLAAVRESAADLVARNGLYGLGAAQQELEDISEAAANLALTPTGLQISGFGQLNLNMDDETVKQLRDYAAAKGYVGLAGSYSEFAQGQALINLGTSGGDGGGGGVDPLITAGLLFGGLGGRPQPQDAPASPGEQADDMASQLGRLRALFDDGTLTADEFAAAKQRVLDA